MIERVSDPITLSLYTLLLKWSVESNNMFVWVWTLCQLNCMTRCASVDPNGSHKFSIGHESIIVKYDDTKCDKDDKLLLQKNVYVTLSITVFVFGLESESGVHCI